MFRFSVIILVSFFVTNSFAGTMCPDGSFVGGDTCVMTPGGKFVSGDSGSPQMAPNGRFVEGGGTPRMAPNGQFVGGDKPMTMCPDGSFVSGNCQLMPNGRFVGE